MTAVRVKTFKDIYEAVMRRLKIPTTDTEALNACKEAINTRMDSIAFRRKWRWRKARYDINVPIKYTTGTVALTQGSRTATGTTTVWTADHKGWFFQASGTDSVYEIVAVDTAAQTFELSAVYSETTNATASYTIFQSEFGLPPDCEEIDVVWHDHRRHQVDIVSPRQIIEAMVKNPGAEGWATAVSAWGFKAYSGPDLGEFITGYDYLGGSDQNDLRLTIFPHVPDSQYTLHVLYTQKLTPLDNDSDEPKLPIEKRHALVYGAYADMLYRERLDDTGAYWDNKFELVVREIEADAEFTDERPQLTVSGKWWRNRKQISPETADLGGWFDRYYTPYDN